MLSHQNISASIRAVSRWAVPGGFRESRPHPPTPFSQLTTFANPQTIRAMSTTNTMNIALPEALRAYVAKRVKSGQYGNTSEYVRELIRRDQRAQDIARLRAMVEDGLASGPARADTEEDWVELHAIARGRLV